MRSRKTEHQDKFAFLIAYDNPELIPRDALAEQWGITRRQLGAIITNLKTNVSVYRGLLKMGYSDKQILSWITRTDKRHRPKPKQQLLNHSLTVDQPIEQVKPEGIPPTGFDVIRDATKPIDDVNDDDQRLNVQTDDQNVNTDKKLETDDLVNLYRQQLGFTEMMREQGFIPYKDKMLKVVAGPDGKPALEEAGPRDIPPQKVGINTVISNLVLRELDIKTHALVRKVAMNPMVYQGHAWAVAKGYFDGDIGDWINFCCLFTLDKGFGARPGMITGKPSILHEILKRE